MANIFRFPYTIGLHDTDAAGLIFSANIFRICHIADEAFLKKIGFGMDVLFSRRTLGLPIVHLEADFQKPLRVGDDVEIRARVAHLGRRSYRMAYELVNAKGECCAIAATVHVCTDPKTFQSIELPVEFRAALENFA
jgi:1,4-dihydroxy-2-naphthoyl-CoA hydrolase